MANGNDNNNNGADPNQVRKGNAALSEQERILEALGVKGKDTVESLKEQNVQLQAAVQTLQSLDNVEMSRNRRAKRHNDMVDYQLQIQDNILKTLTAEYEEAKKNLELTDQQIQQYETQLAAQREITQELEAQKYISEGMADAQEDIASAALKFAGITGKMNLTAKFAGVIGQADSVADAFREIKDEMAATASKAMVVNATSQKISQGIMGIVAMMIEQAIALDNIISSTQQNLNVNKEYASTIDEVYQAQKLNGLTAQQAGESFASLHTQMSSFSQQSAGMRANIAETGAQLSQLGVSAGSFADGMDLSVQALRMSADEARRTQTDLARFAGELGMAPETMAAGFKNAGPSLAKFGANAVKSFKNVAKAAKETGIEMNRIMDYTAQFDTFEGAAERVGSLNAALGGDYLNTMDLMEETDPAKRIQMITDAISASGKSFEEMGYYEKQMFASAAGFSDVEELSRAMSGSLDDNATSTEEAAMSAEEMAEMNRMNLSLQQKMQATLAELAPGIMRIVEVMHKLMIPIMKFVEYGGAYVLPLLIGLRIHFFRLQMQQAANTRELTRHQLAQARSAAATATSTTAVATETVAQDVNTVSRNTNIAAKFRNIMASGRELMISKAQAIANWAETAGIGGKTLATVASTAATWLATASTWALAGAMVAATGGLILIIPAIIGIVMGFKALIEKFGLAKTIGVALGLALAIAFAPVLLIPVAIIAAFWTIWTYWDKIVAGIKAGASFLLEVITAPFVIAWELIKGMWNYFFGASMSPFMEDIVTGIQAGAKMIFYLLTWPYQLAYKAIVAIWPKVKEAVLAVARFIPEKMAAAWTAVKDFFVRNWEIIKSVAVATIKFIARVSLAILTGGMSEVALFIYNKWDQIKEYALAVANWVYAGFAKIAGVGKIILKALKSPFNWLIRMVNSMLSGLEKVFTLVIRVPKILPGPSRYQIGPPSLGRIPELAKGTDNFEGGTALVGEQGPELVNMPQGSAVSPADKTKNFGQTLANIAMTSAQIAGAIAKLTPAAPAVNAIEKVAGAAGGKKQQPVTINVTLELDKRVLARHVEEVMVDKLNPATA
jgi:hypothetical protein